MLNFHGVFLSVSPLAAVLVLLTVVLKVWDTWRQVVITVILFIESASYLIIVVLHVHATTLLVNNKSKCRVCSTG